MTPQEFTALSETDARGHLLLLAQRNEWSERDRMTSAWWKAHGVPINASLEKNVGGTDNTGQSPAMSENSLMLSAGRAVCGIGGLGSVFSAVIAAGGLGRGDPGALGWLVMSYLLAGLCSMGVLFWVAGALEQRLIQIIGRLPTAAI